MFRHVPECSMFLVLSTPNLNEGQAKIDDIHNYRPLDNPMAGTTAKKVHRLIQSLLQEDHIDDMSRLNGFPLHPNLLEYLYFTHLQRFTNRHLLVMRSIRSSGWKGDLSYQGVTALQKVSQLLCMLTTSFSQ